VRSPPRGTTTGDWRRAAARRFVLLVPVAVLGAVLVAVGDEVVEIVGWGILGVALTVAVALVFLEVGFSEDRARAAEDQRRRGPGPV
jgi:hypothetical protein